MINEFTARIKDWTKKHKFSAAVCFLHPIFSFLVSKFSQKYGKQKYFFYLFAANNINIVAPTVLFVVLFSGIEKSIGSKKYSIWMIYSFIFLFICRLKFNLTSSGPTCAIFCPYFTFAFIHQPFLYFKVKKYRFSDSLLYFIAIVQFIFLDFQNAFVDCIICAFSNLFWNLFCTIIRSLYGPIQILEAR
ncbi:hypothetical protein TRFO_16662 [Tritrichomonas foetus]|uniref:Uncharacterized protein n=1 Tax=Tritrichomonas foetus TaxID=1144522 RepID=A0A1J4KQ38_9EUKA|nr:hypothetical protein TRFO_16662 [Tritrichomonas foetus]|eukprot:OHT13226.1 hypothetical protein TRFO_16662 [Tritrichomonas foetus]